MPSSKWFFKYSTVAALLAGYDRRTLTSLRKNSSSILLKPTRSNTRSSIKSVPLRRTLLTRDSARRTSSASRSQAFRSSPNRSSRSCRRACSLAIHSLPSLTNCSIFPGLSDEPIVASSRILPLTFSTTIMPMRPDLCFFLRKNTLFSFASPVFR